MVRSSLLVRILDDYDAAIFNGEPIAVAPPWKQSLKTIPKTNPKIILILDGPHSKRTR